MLTWGPQLENSIKYIIASIAHGCRRTPISARLEPTETEHEAGYRTDQVLSDWHGDQN
jgi:hypothetical protein